MLITHVLLLLLVVFIWGINFLFIKLGLQEISPLLLLSMRFLLVSFPAVFFIKPPAIPFRQVVFYGLVTFGLQFLLTVLGLHVGMTPGLASLIVQLQVFFSIFFAAVIIGERPTAWQITGALVSFLGIGMVAMHFDENISLLGFIFLLGAAATTGVSNLFCKKMNNINMLALVIWGSFVAFFPILALSLIFEGPNNIISSYHHLSLVGVTSMLYTAFASTWVGYGLWNWLIMRYPIAIVVPFSLLIPIVGLLSSGLIFDEPLHVWKLTAGFLVITGLCINLFGERLLAKARQSLIINNILRALFSPQANTVEGEKEE